MKDSKIEWTDHTFNPWWGCTKVSPACDNCYAAALDKRTGGNHWGAGVEADLSSLKANQSVAWGDGATYHIRHTKVGKKEAYCLLDGRTWDEVPA